MKYTEYLKTLLPSVNPYDFKAKETSITNEVFYMLNRTNRMFEYEGLPDSIPARVLELYLQINGNVCFADVDDVLYVFTGGLGGVPNVYYMPTIYTVANPALKLSKQYEIDVDCVVIPNDANYIGLMPMFSKFATAKVENELSLIVAEYNSRIATLISSGDDATKKSAELYLKRIEDGETGVIADSDFLGQLNAVPYGTTGTHTITDLIELEQYIKASWFNALGLNANYNMKRESLNSAESQLNDDALLPLVDDMLYQRQIGLEKVNTMFGTNIAVKLSSAWQDNAQELILKHKEMSADIPEESTEENPEDVLEENPEDVTEENPEETAAG